MVCSLCTLSTVYEGQIVFCRTIESHYQSFQVQVEKFLIERRKTKPAAKSFLTLRNLLLQGCDGWWAKHESRLLAANIKKTTWIPTGEDIQVPHFSFAFFSALHSQVNEAPAYTEDIDKSTKTQISEEDQQI